MSKATVTLKSGAQVVVEYRVFPIGKEYRAELHYRGTVYAHKCADRNTALRTAQSKLVSAR